ncbi:MAG: colanic acid biosynthesis acetyltransferase WcaF [Gloeomargaritaceae cyanobacterium C42_A2020_066]|nr:colanic acid biosynthesis acetyltransferase WcaF [Gloeomargaritaceae cyanobacterium C42_A2020_066]
MIPKASPTSPVRLDQYTLGDYTPGAPLWQQLLWYGLGAPLFRSYSLPSSSLKVWLLRRFGAQIGQGVRIKPGVQVKFPWRLQVGNYVWLGEGAWLDNVAPITVGDHVCISQAVYLCTGNHDWSDPHFQLRPAAITLESGCWLGARAVVGPGVTVGTGAVLTLGSVATRDLEPMTIYAGNPAQPLKTRHIKGESPRPAEP